MAATKIWAVKGNLRSLVDYVENPEKTTMPSGDGMQGLFQVLNYAANDKKTEQKLFVTGVNCLPEIAIQQMIMTKKQFGQTDKILAFHAYQSFKPGEVTPQQCHEIGVKLAQEMWGDRFQVVVATHLDKAHLHNHFALNSVSFRDGGKYNSCKAATKRLRDVSDRLCREYGLSVINNPGKSPNRKTYLAEKNGEPTRYNVFRWAIDRAIEGAMTKTQFQNILRLQGFELKLSGKHWAIKMIGDSKFTRLYRLGEGYTGEAITRRILANERPKIYIPAQRPPSKQYQLKGNFHQVIKLTGYRALYFYFLYRMGLLPKKKTRPPSSPILWENVRQIRKYSEQARLLVNNKIDTAEQLQSFVSNTKNRMDELIIQRTHIQNKLRRAKDPKDIENLKAEKNAITEYITPLRRSLSVAAEIEERSAQMREKLAIIRQLELQEKQQQQSKYRGGRAYAR